MTTLVEELALGRHELVAVVGAGGKSTIVFGLGEELAATGARVILTTTTRVSPDQPTDPISWSAETAEVEARLGSGRPLFVASERGESKIIGIPPEEVDRLYRETSADHVIVEADGARRMAIKAPADHEPAMPSATTMVVVVASLAAVGRPITDVAHRPDLVAALVGRDQHHHLTLEDVATVLLSPTGGLASIPVGSRVTMALTHASDQTGVASSRLVKMLEDHPRVGRVALIG